LENIKFRTYRGLAGDPHTLLIAESGGRTESTLFRENSIFDWSLRLAKIRLVKKMQLLQNNS